ncbi:integral membrane protein [Streptomyces albus]|uniref:Integral membrane protein n=1 Tax=Streptomyces albus (strain ATCC 21838 / DSM 41398 / FERM P-419 / JCM 4703 / NBRC 107858) TaxID=1081613 RepID=A0A0B5F6E6_STRA4|nr:integral membrane protein [Streptomyces albus]AOU80205.1 integral membrane protein [Streptomyces albus]
MNIRSLTRGDGVVIGAAVLLFIASFLDTIDDFGDDTPMAWDNLGLVMSVYVAGIAGAALIVVARGLPNQPKVLGIDLGQAGVVLTVASAWGALWSLIDPGTFVDGGQNVPDIDAGAGLILGFIAALVLAAAAVATLVLPALKAPLAGTPGQAAPQPYGGQPQGGYGYPGGQPQQSFGGQQPYGAPQPGQPQQQAAPAPAAQGGGDFTPFWFAVPVARPLFGEDGAPTPIAELAPGTWYLAVEQRGPNLIAQTQDGRRGVLQDTSGIQRG